MENRKKERFWGECWWVGAQAYGMWGSRRTCKDIGQLHVGHWTTARIEMELRWEVEAKRIYTKRSLIRYSTWWPCSLRGIILLDSDSDGTHINSVLIMCPELLPCHVPFPRWLWNNEKESLGKTYLSETKLHSIDTNLNVGCSDAQATCQADEVRIAGSRTQATIFSKAPQGVQMSSQGGGPLLYRTLFPKPTHLHNWRQCRPEPPSLETGTCGWSPWLCTKWSVSGNNPKVWGIILTTHYILQAYISSAYLYWILHLPKHKLL